MFAKLHYNHVKNKFVESSEPWLVCDIQLKYEVVLER